MAHVFNIGVGIWSLKEGFEVKILSLYLGFWSLRVWGFELEGGGLGVQGLGTWSLSLEALNTNVPFTYFSI